MIGVGARRMRPRRPRRAQRQLAPGKPATAIGNGGAGPGWPLAGGACPAATTRIKRVYKRRFLQNDSNHRHITTDALYAQTTAQGWSGEGNVFCAAQ